MPAETIENFVIDMVTRKMQLSEKEGLRQKTFDELGCDALDVLELILDCEDKYGIYIPTEFADALKTVGDLVKTIEKLVQ